MHTTSARTKSAATERRTLRRLRRLLVDQFAPPICARIRATREGLRQEALDRGDKKTAREFTQERVAQRLHLSLGAYSAYERKREPNYFRRQEISQALGLDASYFETVVAETREQELARLREELAGTRGEMADLRQEVADLSLELFRKVQRPRPAKRRRAN